MLLGRIEWRREENCIDITPEHRQSARTYLVELGVFWRARQNQRCVEIRAECEKMSSSSAFR